VYLVADVVHDDLVGALYEAVCGEADHVGRGGSGAVTSLSLHEVVGVVVGVGRCVSLWWGRLCTAVRASTAATRKTAAVTFRPVCTPEVKASSIAARTAPGGAVVLVVPEATACSMGARAGGDAVGGELVGHVRGDAAREQ
jgi:hypothetical protein